MKITVLVDNPESWAIPYAQQLVAELQADGHEATFVQQAKDIECGELAFFVSCERIVPRAVLDRNAHNLVIHPSAVPQGKGWSPLSWQVLNGKNDIPISLFEAAERVDSGDVYLRDTMRFEGHELVDELREGQGAKVIEMALQFTRAYPNVRGERQQGPESFYSRRTPESSEVRLSDTIEEIFGRLRIADNERYPVFFVRNGVKYVLRVSKADVDAVSD
jgi:methionyl-tRNA formyltransferase